MIILFYLLIPIVILAFVRFLVALLNYLSNQHLKNQPPLTNNMVSVLIPAWNDAKGISNILKDLSLQTYSNFEVIIYEYRLTDATAREINEFIRQDSRFRKVEGNELPNDWVDKNYMNHSLAQYATGDYLIFLSANKRIQPSFIENSLSHMQHKKLMILSLLPFQINKTFGERIVVPVLQWIVLSLLPLRFIGWSYKWLFPIIDQIIMINADFYRKNQFYQQLKDKSDSNSQIIQATTKQRFKMSMIVGTRDDLQGRQFNSYNQAVVNLSEKVSELFGGNHRVLTAFTLAMLLGPILIILIMPYPLVFLYFFSVFMTRMLTAEIAGQSPLKSLLLMPLQQLSFAQIVYRCMKNQKKTKAVES